MVFVILIGMVSFMGFGKNTTADPAENSEKVIISPVTDVTLNVVAIESLPKVQKFDVEPQNYPYGLIYGQEIYFVLVEAPAPPEPDYGFRMWPSTMVKKTSLKHRKPKIGIHTNRARDKINYNS